MVFIIIDQSKPNSAHTRIGSSYNILVGRLTHIGLRSLNCVETLLMHSNYNLQARARHTHTHTHTYILHMQTNQLLARSQAHACF